MSLFDGFPSLLGLLMFRDEVTDNKPISVETQGFRVSVVSVRSL